MHINDIINNIRYNRYSIIAFDAIIILRLPLIRLYPICEKLPNENSYSIYERININIDIINNALIM